MPGGTSPDPQNHNDPHLHLFVDDEEIAVAENVRRVINRPVKHPQPVLVSDRPWEGERAQAWGSVIREPDGLLRMWYFSFNTRRDEPDRGGYAYAESRDGGLHWEKPNLGLVEFRGSRDNNLFYTCAPDGRNLIYDELARRGVGLPALDLNGEQIGIVNNLDGLTVVRDDDDPDPQRRYKLIANMQDHRMWAPWYRDWYPGVTDEQVKHARDVVFGQYVDTSPDGLHWTRRPQKILPAPGGDYMMVMRDHRNRRWWLNERADNGMPGRNAALRTSKDFTHWTDPVVEFDNDNAEMEQGKACQWHGGITPFNYGNLNVGMLERWPTAGLGADCELVVQREGGRWRRVAPGTAFFEVGPEGSFDRVVAFPTHNPPIRDGNRLLFFYTGGGVRTDVNCGVPMSIGLASLTLDRFATLASWRGGEPGRVVTKPLVIPGGHLEINVELLELLPPRVAIATPDGRALPGYGLEESQLDHRPDRPRSRVTWKTKPDLS